MEPERKKSSEAERSLTSPAPATTPAGEIVESSRVRGVGPDPDGDAPLTPPTLPERLKTLVIGMPRDLGDEGVFRHISLIAFLAWVGLGADGLSSSCYGPPEAFDSLGAHRYLAVFLALAIMGTVVIIASCYSHILEEFPSGGGGYLVASKLLGRPFGVVSGCALLVDYVLTITVSIAAAGDALFGLAGPQWFGWKVPAEAFAILGLMILNLRGIKESVQILMPIFVVFLLSHFLLIVGSVLMHAGASGELVTKVSTEVSAWNQGPGMMAMLAVLLYAYSLGAGTYTGLEAVSNSMPVMREPRVATGKRTMLYMAISLAFTAGGLIVSYLLLDIDPEIGKAAGKTLNHVLSESFAEDVGLAGIGLGAAFVFVVLVSEGALLIVGAQAGFIDGPRVLATMAHDSWMPRWFANLSERLATQNGIVLMATAAMAALVYTHGDVRSLVVMYSINVFVTFSLSMIGMSRHWWKARRPPALAAAIGPVSAGRGAVRDDSFRESVREAERRGCDHAAGDKHRGGRFVPHSPLLRARGREAASARRDPGQIGGLEGAEHRATGSEPADRGDPRGGLQRAGDSYPAQRHAIHPRLLP